MQKVGPNWGKIDNCDFFMTSQYHLSNKSPLILTKSSEELHIIPQIPQHGHPEYKPGGNEYKQQGIAM